MKSYKDQIKDWVGNFFRADIHRFNVQGARYYGATFYKRNAWTGMFYWSCELEEAKARHSLVLDLQTGEFI